VLRSGSPGFFARPRPEKAPRCGAALACLEIKSGRAGARPSSELL